MIQYRIRTRRIAPAIKIRLERRLSKPGKILVESGQTVAAREIIGETSRPGSFIVLDAATAWGQSELNLSEFLVKTIGNQVEKGEIIAEYQSRLPFLRRTLPAPITGVLTVVTGKFAVIQTETEPETLEAGIAGQVISVHHNQTVIIETVGAYVEAVCGFGGRAHGVLRSPSYDPLADLESDSFTLLDRQTILMAGGTVDEATIRHAESLDIAGIIVGYLEPDVLKMNPPPQIPIVVTEGVGEHPMARDTFAILQAREGDDVFIQGYIPTLYAPEYERPLIIIPGLSDDDTSVLSHLDGLAALNSQVRILRGPQAMAWGTIRDIPETPQRTDANLTYLGANIALAPSDASISSAASDENPLFISWFNLEEIG